MKDLLFELLKRQLLAMTYEIFTEENVKAVFTRLLTALRVKAAETETEVDDWVFTFLENVITKSDCLERFVQIVRTIIQQANVSGHECAQPQVEKVWNSENLETAMAMDFALLWGFNTPF